MLRMSLDVNPAFRRRGIQATLVDRVTLDAQDMRRLTELLGREFRRHERRLFATEGRHGGRKWRRLTEPYRTRKARRYPGRKILQRTGRLRKSMTQRSHPDHVATWSLRRRPRILLGTAVSYAVWHALGTPTMARRDPLQHKARQQSRYTRIIVDYLVEKAERIARRNARFNRASRRGRRR